MVFASLSFSFSVSIVIILYRASLSLEPIDSIHKSPWLPCDAMRQYEGCGRDNSSHAFFLAWSMRLQIGQLNPKTVPFDMTEEIIMIWLI